MCSTGKMSSCVLDDCRRSPLTRPSTVRGSRPSPVAMHGPIGAKVSNPLQRVYCGSFRCSSRAVTSLTQIRPRIPGVRRLDAVRALPDHQAEFGLVLDAADARRQANRIARTDQRRRRLEEQQRLGRQRLAHFPGVILVVEPDADHL